MMHSDRSLETSPSIILIALTLFLSLVLEFLPWPGWTLRIKPSFPDLALVYWVIHQPRIINYVAALMLGVLMDIAGQLPLGFTPLMYTLITFMANRLRGRFSLLGPVGQGIHVLFLLSVGQAVLFLLKLLDAGELSQFNWELFAPSASAAALWLFLPLFMQWLSSLLRGKRDE
jgi:rod shape-determining protein MreD